MKKLRYLLPVALIMLAFSSFAGTVIAAPSPTRVSISSNAEYVSPTMIQVEVTITCAPTAVVGFVNVQVFEPSTGGQGSGPGFPNTPCTGSAQTFVVNVTGALFTPGRAYANATACAGFCDQAQRQIQIVL